MHFLVILWLVVDVGVVDVDNHIALHHRQYFWVLISIMAIYHRTSAVITLRGKLSGAVYCYRSSPWQPGGQCLWVCGWVCYHDNSKFRASIFTKLGLWVKVVTLSSWLNFGRPAPPGRGSAEGRNFLGPSYYSQRTVFASLWVLFSSMNSVAIKSEINDCHPRAHFAWTFLWYLAG